MQSEKYPGMTVDIHRNEATTAERILGVRLALARGDDEEFKLGQTKQIF